VCVRVQWAHERCHGWTRVQPRPRLVCRLPRVPRPLFVCRAHSFHRPAGPLALRKCSVRNKLLVLHQCSENETLHPQKTKHSKLKRCIMTLHLGFGHPQCEKTYRRNAIKTSNSGTTEPTLVTGRPQTKGRHHPTAGGAGRNKHVHSPGWRSLRHM
jgi:hypothetical protein